MQTLYQAGSKVLPVSRAVFSARNSLRAAALPLAVLVCSCASAGSMSTTAGFKAPWSASEKPSFQDLLVSYGASNLATRRQETLDRYLRSQTKTFDRYIAAKEVGVGIAQLEQEATAEIQSLSPRTAATRYLVATTLDVQAFDSKLGGFPVYQEPFDVSGTLRYVNDDVRTVKSTARYTRGMSVAADSYGFLEADVRVSKLGWVIPATPDQAISTLEAVSERGESRKVAVAMTFSLDRCDPAQDEPTRLVCQATIRTLSGYKNLNAVRPENVPVVELMKREVN